MFLKILFIDDNKSSYIFITKANEEKENPGIIIPIPHINPFKIIINHHHHNYIKKIKLTFFNKIIYFVKNNFGGLLKWQT